MDVVNGREYSMKGFRKVNSHYCVDLRPCFETGKFLSPLDFGKIL